MPSYHLEDDLEDEVRRVRDQNGPENEQEGTVTGVPLIGFSCSAEYTDVYEVYEPCSLDTMFPSILKLTTNFFVAKTLKNGESTLHRGKLVGYHDVASRHGPLDDKVNGIEPEPTKYVPSGVAKPYGPECGLSSGLACAILDRAAWEYPLSRGCMMDTREKESSLIILRLEGRGRISYPGLGVWNT
ncbi:hypothetical protein CRG98_009941 [Punica granatum]|uniref:Uncharacterized protein n=1 Tax=Punica granatum TaxID=22663 RepID=A0A2I0KMV6_PUNGR|nr:hypothetical protein CRG98_009941 [Punica granatum]